MAVPEVQVDGVSEPTDADKTNVIAIVASFGRDNDWTRDETIDMLGCLGVADTPLAQRCLARAARD